MHDCVITCLKCGAQRTFSHLPEPSNLTDAEVLAQAGHSPKCMIAQSGKGTVQYEQRPDEPTVMLYSIVEVR